MTWITPFDAMTSVLMTRALYALRGNPMPDDGFSIRLFDRMKRESVKIEPGFDPLQD